MTSKSGTWTSPLVEIEREVQNRAKQLALDLSASDGIAGMRLLIEKEVSRWADDYKRGTRPHVLADPAAVSRRALRNLTGYGPLEPLLDDDDVWEICINGPDQIFVKRHLGQSGYHNEIFHDDDHVVRTLTKILDEATGSHRKFDPAQGLQDAQLKNGARLHIVHSDIARDNHTIVNIRKFTGVAIRSLSELVERQMLTGGAATLLRACVQARLSIVFAGPPGSGKTTLMSCCAAELDPELRVVVAEEVFEADIPLPNVAHMQTRAARADRAEVDLRRLVAGFLRMAPDVAIVGEVRDREAPRRAGNRHRPAVSAARRCCMTDAGRWASIQRPTSSPIACGTSPMPAPLNLSYTYRRMLAPRHGPVRLGAADAKTDPLFSAVSRG